MDDDETHEILKRTMENELHKFAQNNNLWIRTKEAFQICVQNYIIDGIEIDYPDLKNVRLEDFEISKKSQSLIFWQYDSETFIIRTTFNIKLKNKILGYYSLDVDKKGNNIDDWLVFE